MKSSTAGLFLLTVLPILTVSGAGCRSSSVELIPVSGAVTLDGAPLERATVVFLPIVQGTESARPSSAKTDASGKYQLQYSTKHSGARPGKYRVQITTFVPGEPLITKAIPERVPPKYNSKTTLEVEVDSKHRNFDFDLKTDKEKIVQPVEL